MMKHFYILSMLLWGWCLSMTAADTKEVYITRTGDVVTIGNEFLAREFSLANGRVSTRMVVNKRTGKNPVRIIPEAASEEFLIRTLVGPDSVAADICSSKLSLDDVQLADMEKNGRKLTFHYRTFRFEGVDWQINMVFTLEKGKHYMKKYLEITVPDSQRSQARIDYIDFEPMKLPEGIATWAHPEMEKGVGGVSGYYISLGQPVYVQAMFFGLEFPAAETEITKDNTVRIRYYSGKNFEMLAEEGRLEEGTFSTWKEVIGATRSTDMDVIQTDFFSYIQDISVPIDLRIQYNSWYDFMLDINENNILDSFREVERGLTQNGVRPLDSYVVDDGWNAYGPWQEENKTGFWSFNSKFPNELVTPSDLSHRLASDFGLWLGPRGGYNYYIKFARFLEENGNGKLNRYTNDICTNHKVYLQKMKTFFLYCQQKFGVNYWKLDGFLVRAPQPDPQGNYISGGYQGMYYVTEHWERWIDILRAIRDQRGEKRDDLWINLTCYVNPSPWFLQWANSVWMQNSQDIGRLNVKRPSQLDQLLSYRDDRYFDFVKTRAFQFPLAHIYNHDPIYGSTAKLAGKMDDDEFRTYLMMMATRGTAFWELYYSYNMMNEGQKWVINADVLHWIQDNYPILKHAKLIGQTPAKGTPYGFSAWSDGEGIISVRNPSDQVKKFSFILDRTIGMPEGLKGLYRTTVWTYRTDGQGDSGRNHLFGYGEEVSLSLQPGEVRIWKFSTTADKKVPVLRMVKTTSPTTLTVEFNEPVVLDEGTFIVPGNEVKSVSLSADRRMVTLTLAQEMEQEGKYRLDVSGVKDDAGNGKALRMVFNYFENQEIPASIGVVGGSDFNLSFCLKTDKSGVSLLHQGKDLSVDLDIDGHLVFMVGGLKVISGQAVNNNSEFFVSLCRERNGMLKIYLNGELEQSAYDVAIVNPDIKPGKVIVNSSLGNAISRLKIKNRALDYKENKKMALPF